MSKQKKLIIFVLHSLAIGGAERQFSSIANYMSDKGMEIHILLIDSPAVSFELNDGIKAVCVNQSVDFVPDDNVSRCELFRMNSRPKTDFFTRIRLHLLHGAGKSCKEAEFEEYLRINFAQPLHEYLKAFPDAVIVSCMTIPNLSTMMAAQDLPNRVVFSDRTSPQTEYPPDSPVVALKQKYYLRAQAAVFQTPEARDYYTYLNTTKKYLIPNYIKSDNLPERYTGKRKEIIVNFCRLHPVKNIPLLFDAFEMLLCDYPGYKLEIYGEGKIFTELNDLIASKGLSESIKMYGFDLNIHDKVKDYAMFVSSSDREGISNSMLEALAIGLPCVCTDCPAGGARMMIKDGENGLLTPVGEKTALYRAMKRIIESPSLSDKLSENSVKIKKELTLERIAELWTQVL